MINLIPCHGTLAIQSGQYLGQEVRYPQVTLGLSVVAIIPFAD